jgi:hypothetical protein
VRLAHPGRQAAQRVAGVTDGLWSVEVGVQVKAQVALDHGVDLRGRAGWGEPVNPAARGDSPGGWSVDLAEVEQQHVHRVQASDRRTQVPVGGLGRWSPIRRPGVELSDWVQPQSGGEGVYRGAELVEVVDSQDGQVRVAAVQQHPAQRPDQLGARRCVAELGEPGHVPVEQPGVDAEAAVAGLELKWAGERPGEKDRVVQADAVHQ